MFGLSLNDAKYPRMDAPSIKFIGFPSKNLPPSTRKREDYNVEHSRCGKILMEIYETILIM